MSGEVRVLVCDDQAVIRAGFVAILGAHDGIDVVGEAGDGAEAVRLAEQLRPDVVLMDLRMPVLDGVEATRRPAGPSVKRPVRVLVVTTFSADTSVYAALQADASGFLLKDATPAELVAGVRTVARGDALLSGETVKTHVSRILGKLALRDRVQAVVVAHREGVAGLDQAW